MPEGLEKDINPQAMADLIAYLLSLEQVGARIVHQPRGASSPLKKWKEGVRSKFSAPTTCEEVTPPRRKLDQPMALGHRRSNN